MCLISRLQRGAVSLHQTLLCSQAMQAVPEQPVFLQVRSVRPKMMSTKMKVYCQSKLKFVGQTNCELLVVTPSKPLPREHKYSTEDFNLKKQVTNKLFYS